MFIIFESEITIIDNEKGENNKVLHKRNSTLVFALKNVSTGFQILFSTSPLSLS